MPRRFFKKFALKRHHFHKQWYLKPFQSVMKHPVYWGITRRTVVPAASLGIFIAFVPLPIHTLLSVTLPLIFRVNIPVTFAATLISNPLTMGPMFYFSYRVGLALIGMEPQPFDFDLSFEWVSTGLANTWQPLFLGCFMVGAAVALLTYISLDSLWRVSIGDYLRKRRAERAVRETEQND